MEDNIQVIKSEPELEIIDTVNRPFKCEICTKSFSLQNTLKIHKLTHSGEKPFKCEICDESFILSSILKTHQLTHQLKQHIKKKRYICSICEKTFESLKTFQKHKTSHVGSKTFKCNSCNRKFAFKVHLVKHELNHLYKCTKTNRNEKRFSCDLCRCDLVNEEKLLSHKQQHKCQICGEWFRRIPTRKLHSRNAHMQTVSSDDEEKTELVSLDESIFGNIKASVNEGQKDQIYEEVDSTFKCFFS